MDLSKGFDTINQDLLIAKFHAYGFHKSSHFQQSNLFFSCLNNIRRHMTKIKQNCSSWEKYSKGFFKDLSLVLFFSTFIQICSIRSSHPEVFLGKDVLKRCSKFTGEHPSRSVISIKLLLATFLKSHFGMDVLL